MKIKKVDQSAGVVANVVDNLNSNSAIDALSAKMGKELSNKIGEIESILATLTTVEEA